MNRRSFLKVLGISSVFPAVVARPYVICEGVTPPEGIRRTDGLVFNPGDSYGAWYSYANETEFVSSERELRKALEFIPKYERLNNVRWVLHPDLGTECRGTIGWRYQPPRAMKCHSFSLGVQE